MLDKFQTPRFLFMVLSIFISVTTAVAHEKHSQRTNQVQIPAEINEEYRKNVKPIFIKSCFDCHSSSTVYPWYSSIPLAQQIIASDIKEGRKHLDFSHDFPFGGHGAPAEDLEAILKAVESNTMPPLRYRILHSKAKLSAEEKQVLKKWIEESITKLKSSGSKNK